MKYLLMLLSTICLADNPRYKAGDILEYSVPEFYKNICTGKGKVIEYWSEYQHLFTFKRTYNYKCQDLNPECPVKFIVKEYEQN